MTDAAGRADDLGSGGVPISSRADHRPFAAAATTGRRLLVRHRRLVAALLAGAAVFAAVHVLAPAPPPSVVAVVAARDLESGLRLTPDDLTTARVARSLMPTAGTLSEPAAIGQILVAPMRAGEVITDRAVLGRSMLAGYPSGTVATSIRLPDAEIAALLHTGDHIDVYAAVAEVGAPASLVAADVVVIAVPRPADDERQSGAAVVLAATPDQAARLAGAAATGSLAVDIRP
jgi:Flp pilus assembly protein CpaB